MGSVTGLTAARMLAIEAASVVGGAISGNDLVLTKHDGTTFNAGNVRGPQGPQGYQGVQGPQGFQGVQGNQGFQGGAGSQGTQGVGRPTLVNALPGSPTDGQEVYFQDATMAAAGQMWHLRYRAAASGSFKWEFVGGGEIYITDNTQRTVTSVGGASFGGITLSVPLAGDYMTDFGCRFFLTVTGQNPQIYWHNGVVGNDLNIVEGVDVANSWKAVSRSAKVTGAAASSSFRFYGASAAGTINIIDCFAKMKPIRVG